MRIIFNTTFIVDETIESEWTHFIRQQYIAYLREKNLTLDILFTKVSIDQPEGKTYSLQLIFGSGEALQHFTDNHREFLEEKLQAKYKNRYLCFSSTLSEV